MDQTVKHQIAIAATQMATDKKARMLAENQRRQTTGEPLFEIPSEDELVREQTWRIIEQLGDRSAAFKVIDQYDGMVSKADNAGIFIVDVVGIEQDPRNQRGIVSFLSVYPPSEKIETISTEPYWMEEGSSVVNRTISLVGHRCALHKDMTQFKDNEGNSKKLRVLRHLKDLGPTPQDRRGGGR